MKVLKANNSGFSLVEIIITVVIASVITSTASYGLSLSSGKPAEKCARSLSSVLSHARTTAMGKYRNEISISNTGSGYIVNENIIISLNDDNTVKESSTRSSTVGSSNVTIEYCVTGSDSDSDSFTQLESGDTLTLTFDSGSGALNTTIALASAKEGDSKLTVSGSQLRFKISKSGTVKYVNIVKLTGNISTS